MELPDLLKTAISSAYSSGRKLSWKIQEGEKGTLIQLVWKSPSCSAGTPERRSVVHSNWNKSSKVRKSKPPSKVARSNKRLKAFIERKQRSTDSREDCSSLGPPSTSARPEACHSRVSSRNFTLGWKWAWQFHAPCPLPPPH